MKRIDWKGALPRHGNAPWPCPSCKQPNLSVVPDSLMVLEGKESDRLRSHYAWEPEWIEGRFACLLTCVCSESVAVIGKQSEHEVDNFDQDGEVETKIGEVLTPLFFEPPLALIELPPDTPEEVASELVKSFSQFWCDPDASAGHIRSAVEALLDWKKIKRFTRSKGKRHILSLHPRIDRLPNRESELAELLRAVKWIGNAGAHAAHLTTDDLLDAYEILDVVIENLFVKRGANALRLAKAIIRKRKPRSLSTNGRRF